MDVGIHRSDPVSGDHPNPILLRVQQLTHAHRQRVTVAERRGWGQFFTPLTVAKRMVEMVAGSGRKHVRILDPGAGTGLLGLSAAFTLLARADVRVSLVAVEAEPGAHGILVDTCKLASRQAGGRLECQVVWGDYLAKQTRAGMAPFDLVIANPPYGKISPRDRRGGDSPNLYTRFMEVAAGQLRPGGELICIVPRSFTSGSYFRRFRARLHATMALEKMHVFASRRAAFASDGVLQETVIFRYRKGESRPGEHVTVTSCKGVSPGEVEQRVDLPRGQILAGAEPGAAIYIPRSAEDVQLLVQLRRLRQRIEAFGCQVSTGKIVPFRCRPQLRATDIARQTVPLLWMQHVRAGRVQWPLGDDFSKPEHILATAPGLVRNQNLVVIRRLSSKDEARRITATVVARGALPGRVWGLENHLNYLYRVGGELTLDEAWGLMTYLNSEPVDRYVRITNGHTQVNACELRDLPMPGVATLRALGQQVRARPSEAARLVLAAIARATGVDATGS